MKNLFLSLAVIATLTVVSCKEKAAESTTEGTEVPADTAVAPTTDEVTAPADASATTEVATPEAASETK